MDDYQSHDAVGLAELVRLKKVSAEELLDAARARADQVNGRINAIVVDVDPPRSAQRDRTVRRRTVPAQGPRPRPRGLPHQRRLAVAGHDARRRERHRRPALARRGAGRVRKDQHPGVRRQGRHRVALVRPGPQPVEHRPHAGRLLGRRGGCGRRRHRAVRGGQRRWRLDPDPGLGVRPLRPQALAGARARRPATPGRNGRRGDQRRRLALGPRHRGDARRARGRYAGRSLPAGPARDVVRRRGRPGSRPAPHRPVHGQRHQPEATRRGDRGSD